MKKFLVFGAFALLATPTFADEVVIKREPGAVVERRATDDGVTTEKTVRHDADGCATRSVTKTNEEGGSVTRTNSNCD